MWTEGGRGVSSSGSEARARQLGCAHTDAAISRRPRCRFIPRRHRVHPRARGEFPGGDDLPVGLAPVLQPGRGRAGRHHRHLLLPGGVRQRHDHRDGLAGQGVRTLEDGVSRQGQDPCPGWNNYQSWDGTDDAGKVVPDGVYTVHVHAVDGSGQAAEDSVQVGVDTRKPGTLTTPNPGDSLSGR